MKTVVITPKKGGNRPQRHGIPIVRINHSRKNVTVYFYQEAVKYLGISAKDGVYFYYETPLRMYLVIVPQKDRPSGKHASYTLSISNSFSLYTQVSTLRDYNFLPGYWEILAPAKHPDFPLLTVYPIKYNQSCQK